MLNVTGPQVCVISVLVEEWRDINGANFSWEFKHEMQVIILTCNISTPSLSGGLQNVQGGAQINSTTLEICPGGLLEFDMVFVDSDPAAELILAPTICCSAWFSVYSNWPNLLMQHSHGIPRKLCWSEYNHI